MEAQFCRVAKNSMELAIIALGKGRLFLELQGCLFQETIVRDCQQNYGSSICAVSFKMTATQRLKKN
jgi:hypothetical protein